MVNFGPKSEQLHGVAAVGSEFPHILHFWKSLQATFRVGVEAETPARLFKIEVIVAWSRCALVESFNA